MANPKLTSQGVVLTDEKTLSTLQQIFDLVHPKGEVYVQYPWQKNPNDLYTKDKNGKPNGIQCVWDEDTRYDGAFFRSSGTDSEAFGTLQPEGLPNSIATFTVRGTDYENSSLIVLERGPEESGMITSYGLGGHYRDCVHQVSVSGRGHEWHLDLDKGRIAWEKYTLGNTDYPIDIYGKSRHVTPKNYTIRIWYRKQ